MPSSSEKPAPRCLILFWSVSGAGIRCGQRIGAELSHHFGPDNVAFSLHEGNAWLHQAKVISADVDTVKGKGGRKHLMRTAWEFLPQFQALLKQLKRFRPDLIIIPMNFAQAWPLSRLLEVMKFRIVYVIHDLTPHPGDYAPHLQKISQHGVLKSVHQVVAVSEFCKNAARDFLPQHLGNTLETIPLVSFIRRQRDKPRQLGQGPVRFLFLGRLLGYKGLDILSEALHALRHRQDWSLTIAGHGPYRDRVISSFGDLQQVDISHLVLLHENEIDKLLESHDVLVCPYIEASQSGVIAEASAIGLPCLITPVGALPEQVGYGTAGWIARSSEAQALKEEIITMLDNRQDYFQKSTGALSLPSQSDGDSAWGQLVRRLTGSQA